MWKSISKHRGRRPFGQYSLNFPYPIYERYARTCTAVPTYVVFHTHHSHCSAREYPLHLWMRFQMNKTGPPPANINCAHTPKWPFCISNIFHNLCFDHGKMKLYPEFFITLGVASWTSWQPSPSHFLPREEIMFAILVNEVTVTWSKQIVKGQQKDQSYCPWLIDIHGAVPIVWPFLARLHLLIPAWNIWGTVKNEE